ncbi:MAG: SseB family protein [Nocardioidaceae bacterium]
MRTIPDPGFADDTGAVSTAVTETLTRFEQAPAEGYAEVIAALHDSRLLVPVVATLGEVEYDEHGLAHDKTSDMATVLMRAPDGRLGLLAFTSIASMQRWDPAARPVPVAMRLAAKAALQDGADVVVVDVAGPVTFVVGQRELRALADGLALVRIGDDLAWAGTTDTGGR